MNGSIYLFINFKQALNLGHVAWGFAIDEETDRYFYGSSDHLWTAGSYLNLPAAIKYASVEPKGNIDWWAAEGSKEEMLTAMRAGDHIRYHAGKTCRIDNSNPEFAREMAERIKDAGWHVANNNCVHQAYNIFRAYGMRNEIRNPTIAGPIFLIPKLWFASWPGTVTQLRPYKIK